MNKKNWFLEHIKENPIDLEGIEKKLKKKIESPHEIPFQETPLEENTIEKECLDWEKEARLLGENSDEIFGESFLPKLDEKNVSNYQ